MYNKPKISRIIYDDVSVICLVLRDQNLSKIVL